MIKGDTQITENGINVLPPPPIPLGADLKVNFSQVEVKTEILVQELNAQKIEVRVHFGRLKKRMRGRSSGIL